MKEISKREYQHLRYPALKVNFDFIRTWAFEDGEPELIDIDCDVTFTRPVEVVDE